MQNWRSYNNFRKLKNSDGSVACLITVDGEDIAVSREVYVKYAKIGRKIKYMELDLKSDRVNQDASGKAVRDENGQPVLLPEREISLDKLIDEGWDYLSSAPSTESVVIGKSEAQALYRSLDLLSTEERALIQMLFFEDMTERECAATLGITQKAVNKRKHKILEKLKKILLKN